MTSENILQLLDQVRPSGTDRWIARCPAHDDRSPSLTIRRTSDRVLLHCFGGCRIADVCAAIGIRLADLYIDSQHRQRDLALDRRFVAVDALDRWRQAEIRRVAEELRGRDVVVREVVAMMKAGRCSENQGWDTLANEWAGYSLLEHQFECLLRDQHTVQIWRERSAS